MATLGTAGAIGFLSMGGKKAADNQPPINAGSKEEENFVKNFVKKAEGEKKH
jgi:F-type H+-transporting ATPase subunit k